MQKELLIFFTALLCLYPFTAQAEDTISIQGTLLMLDDMTPHVAVPVQALRNGEVIATVLSDVSGKYQFINLNPGWYQLRCQVLGGYVYYRATGDALRVIRYEEETPVAEENSGESLYIRDRRPLKNIDFRFAPFKKGTWKTYTCIDGLVDDSLMAVYRDPNGIIWFATDVGVSRYDGNEFVNFTTKDGLANNEVMSIYSGSDGVMWFGTMDGVSRYDGNEFTNFTTKDGLAHNIVTSIYRDPDGMMWFGKSGGVSRYDGNEFTHFTRKDGLAGNMVRSIYRDPDGVMWFGTNGGISRYDGSRFINFTEKDGLAHNHVTSIYRDPDGVMWFGTWGGGVSRYDGNEFANFTTKDGLAGNVVRAIYYDPDGVMWFATHSGVSRYDGTGFVNFTTMNGLGDTRVSSISRDLDGMMWFATNSGTSRYFGGGFVNYTIKDGLAHNYVWSISRDPDGVMWFGTWGGGVSRYDGNEFINFTTEDGLAHNSVQFTYCDPDGVMWFGTGDWRGGGGVSQYDGKGFVNLTTKDGLADNRVRAIHRAPDGIMWFGTYDGSVSRYDGKEFVNFSTKDGLTGEEIRSSYCAADGVMWFGTRGGGVFRYDGDEFVNFTTKDGLVDDYVESIHRDPDGVLWFGTRFGVSRYDGQRFVNFSKEGGLPYNRIECIYRTSYDLLCFGTFGGGVCLYDGDAWSSLDMRDGLAGNVVSLIHQDADGSLWFATNGGVTRYRRSTTPPKMRVISVTADETYSDLAAIPAFAIGTHVSIEYSALDFKTVPEKRQYKIRIKETDSDWRRPTKEASFDHTFKEPGTYTFQVKAIDRDLNYSDPASVEIRILPPPIYTRAGFIIGCILAAFLIPTIIYTVVLMRQKRVQEFVTISNPYIVGNPIRSKGMFYGRRRDFEFVRMKLSTEESGMVIVFAGARRSGKTSILFQILNGELGERILPVLLDMQAMAVNDEAEFFEKMASEIGEALVDAGLTPASTDFRSGNPIRAFEGFIAQTMETLGGRGLVLLFDEYELIETKIDDGTLRPDIITFFASLLEAHPRLSFIFTGSQHLEGRKIPYWRVLIGKSMYRRISFLAERDALSLITEPLADRVKYPAGVPERIIRLTAGQPFYTQVVCQNLIDRLNEMERDRVRQDDVDAVAQELADNPLPQMIYFWDGLEQNQRNALSLLGELLVDPNRYASAQTLLSFVQEENLDPELDLSALERTLSDLFTDEILERERAGEGKYEYRFRADLFRLWIRQAHSVWQQA